MRLTDQQFLKELFNRLSDRPLEPTDDRYEPLYEGEVVLVDDPVRELLKTIEFSEVSTQLFSGFRGTGKSTELRRLRRSLEGLGGYRVLLIDMQDVINLHTPIEVSDFLLAVAGSVGDGAADLLGTDPAKEGFWARFTGFLRHRVQVKELGLSANDPAGIVGAQIKANIKADPSFKERLQVRMQGHLGALVDEVHRFIGEVAEATRRATGGQQLVILLDSIEQIRGTSTNAREVFASVENLFVGHPERLRLPGVHVVYTAPPWLKIRAPGVGQNFDGAVLLPCVRVRHQDGSPDEAAVGRLMDGMRRRGQVDRVVDASSLRRLVLESGGHLRDLVLLLQDAAKRAAIREELPLSPDQVERCIAHRRGGYLPIANNDALWLARVARTHQPEVPDQDALPELSRFFDTHLILCYRNGQDWFDVHPLVKDAVLALATRTDQELHA